MDVDDDFSDIEDQEFKEYVSDINASRVADYTKCRTYEIIPNTVAIHPSGISSVAATRHMRWLYTAGEDGEIRRYDFINSINGQSMLTQVQKHGYVESITQNAVMLSSWENEEYVPEEEDKVFYQVQKNKSVKEEDPTNENTQAAQPSTISPNSTSAQPEITTVSPENEKAVNPPVEEYLYRKVSPAFSIDVHSQAIFGLTGFESGTINLWSLRHDEGTCHYNFRGHTGIVSVIKISPDEQTFVSGSWDKTIALWDLNNGKKIQTYTKHKTQLSMLSYQPTSISVDDPLTGYPTFMRPSNNSTLLSTSVDGKTYTWDKRTLVPARSLVLKDNKTPPWALSSCWSADGNYVYIGRRNATVDEWDVREGKLVRQLNLPKGSGPVSSVACLPNGKQIVCASYDNIRMWNLNENDSVLDVEHILSKNTTNVPIVPFIIIPGHHGGTISQIYIDPSCRFMVTASGNRGWHEHTTNNCLFYTIKPLK